MLQPDSEAAPASEAGKKPSLMLRAAAQVDGFMATKLGWTVRTRDFVFHEAVMLWDQVMAVVPITILQVR